MTKKLFLDTNIVIDVIDKKRVNHKKAQDMIIKTILNDYEIFMSEDMITTIYYILSGNILVLNFFKEIISKWNIMPFGQKTIKQSIEYSLKNGTDLEDTLQCFCAKNSGCDIFLTYDKKFIDCGIKIVDYDEFLKDL